MALSILPITDGDLPFVREMLYEAAFWRGSADAPPIEEALARPELAVYVQGWGRPGDAGLIARVDGAPVGAVWARLFPAEEHGYGFIDESTPELSLGVAADRRGVGLGRCLMTAMLVELRLHGLNAVSLSVEIDNTAHALYESLGFVPRQTADGAATMIRTLPSHRS